MNIKTLSLNLLVCFFVLSACAPAIPVQPTAPTATEQPNIPETTVPPTAISTTAQEPKTPEAYPLSTRTGIAEVDEVLAAVESGDAQSLRELVRFTTVGCTKVDGMGGPPKCRDGEAEGTPVNVLPLLGPEGSFIHESDLANFNPMPALELYAVYSQAASAYAEEAYPAGKYAAIFTTREGQLFIVYQIDAGIVRIDTVFSSETRDAVIQRDALEMILAPK